MGYCFLYKRGRGGGGNYEIVKTVLGKFISISDSATKPLRGLRVFGKTTQNGTPTPDTPVPLESVGDGGSVEVTVCGKNLLNKDSVNIINAWFATTISTPMGGDRSLWIPVTPNTTYTVSRGLINTPQEINRFKVGFTKERPDYGGTVYGAKGYDGSTETTISITTDSDAKYLLVFFWKSGGSVSMDDMLASIQIEQGATATTYEPHKGGTATFSTPNGLPGIPVSSGGNFTDSTGQQWVCDEVDFARGKYVQRISEEQLKNLVFEQRRQGHYYTRSTTVLDGIPSYDHTSRAVMMCNVAPIESLETSIDGNVPALAVCDASSLLGAIFIEFVTPQYTTLEQFQSWFDSAEIYVIYALATPIETDLTEEQLAAYAALHTNHPSTTIYNDAGADMEVKYISIEG